MTKPVFDRTDFEQHRLVGAFGYLLFFIPLIANGKSRFCRFCANQGALALIVYLALSLIGGMLSGLLGWIPLIGWLFRLLFSLVRLACIALICFYGWNAYQGKAEPLPFIGGIELIR